MAIHRADPFRLTRHEADRWCRDFDNWALCDTAAFPLFDRTPWRWSAAEDWTENAGEYVRRAGLATLWGLFVHDKAAEDAVFIAALNWAVAVAGDARAPVRKAVDVALRAVEKRNAALNGAVCAAARGLADGEDPTSRWIGRHVLKELESDKVRARLGLH